MSSPWITKAVDILEDRLFDLSARRPWSVPDQLGVGGLEECLDRGVVVAIAFTAHRHSKPCPNLPWQRFLGMDLSTLNRNIRAMERKGRVRFTDDPDDGRKKHVTIVDEGRSAFARAVPFWEQAQADTKAMTGDYDWAHERSWLQAVSGK